MNPRKKIALQRAFQKKKYRFLLDKTDGKYGSSFSGAVAKPLVKRIGPDSVLDVGCGGNQFVTWLRNKMKIRAIGIDIANPFADMVRSAHDTQLPFKSFCMVTAFDLLEHLVPEEIDQVLGEFCRVSWQWLVFKISYEESKRKPLGESVHLTVKSKLWWKEKLEKYLTCVNQDPESGCLYGVVKPGVAGEQHAVVTARKVFLCRHTEEREPGNLRVA